MWPHLSTSYLAQVSHRRRLVLSPCILLFTRNHLFQVAPSADFFEADPIASSWTEIIRDKNTHTKKQFSCGDGADVAVAVRSLLIIIKKTGLRAAWAVRMVQAGNHQQPRSSETNERRNNEAAGISRRSLTKNRDMVMKLQPSSSGRSRSEWVCAAMNTSFSPPLSYSAQSLGK